MHAIDLEAMYASLLAEIDIFINQNKNKEAEGIFAVMTRFILLYGVDGASLFHLFRKLVHIPNAHTYAQHVERLATPEEVILIATAREIQKLTNCHWLILGGKADVQLSTNIARELTHHASRTTNVSGQTSLRELMALLKLSRVLLTNDTGPMHVAAALGTPVVVPFGSTSPELTGPGMPGDPRHRLLKSDAPCSPCFLRECPIDFRCMNGISVECVVEAVITAVRV